ncbi:MAG: APC family permease [Aliidongia sp.]
MADDLRAVARQFATGKQRQVLSTPHIVFLVVAAAAPLAAIIGNLPIALARGAGVGTPAAFLFAGLTLLCFAVGYAAMSRHVVNTGAFYTYVAKGLGKPAGVGAAFTAVAAYVSFTIGLAAFLGYFLDLVLVQLGLHGSWVLYAGIGIALVAVLGYRSIDLSSKILGALMIAEIAILAVFDAAVILAKGADALPAQSFSPEIALAPGMAVALMVAFTSFIGFESAALYGEEAKDPARSVPAATYASVILIALFYLVTAWVTVGAAGPDQVTALATSDGGLLMFDLIGRYSGEAMADLTSIVVCTSLLASYLAIHNGATRYVFALSREKLLPPVLGKFHPTRYAPSNASLTVSALTAVFVGGVGLATADPYPDHDPGADRLRHARHHLPARLRLGRDPGLSGPAARGDDEFRPDCLRSGRARPDCRDRAGHREFHAARDRRSAADRLAAGPPIRCWSPAASLSLCGCGGLGRESMPRWPKPSGGPRAAGAA